MLIIWPVINGCARVCAYVRVRACVVPLFQPSSRVWSTLWGIFSPVVGLEYPLGDILYPRMSKENGNGKISLLSDDSENIFHPS